MTLRPHTPAERMVAQVLTPAGITDERTLEAMRRIPRENFLEEALRAQAYGNYALPIGQGQTLSQPLTVATMTQALALRGDEAVLEIGTGSGYQTAVLALVCRQVYSVERLLPLVLRARKNLEQLGLKNAMIRAGDGTMGWNEYAPYDAILVTAGSPTVPQTLFEQLREGGRLVIPVGPAESQELQVFHKSEGELHREALGDARFVKLVGAHGWNHR
ncbi:MAG: protein-L-isoaspartate O-methyltransferase [Deltaproteobacteria bacterium RIFOXYA12_FULL_61_11]|nr:MAG: protein-L-isoaspartate O-methyltransferase [Deltaproteobacteria bacterium RIFOXYA12_FULL_61_11]